MAGIGFIWVICGNTWYRWPQSSRSKTNAAGVSVVVVEAAPDLFPGSASARFSVDLVEKYPDLAALLSLPEFRPQTNVRPDDLHQYLLAYVEHFKLRQHTIFSCKLEHAQPRPGGGVGEDGRWCIVCSDLLDPQRLHRLTSDYLIISAGACLEPSIPQLPQGSADFAGVQYHARELKGRELREVAPLVSGQHVVVAGDDRTAVECARGAADAGAASVTLVFRQPHWPLPAKLLGRALPHLAYDRCLPSLLFPPYYTAGGPMRALNSALAPLRRLFWWRLQRRLVRKYGVDELTRPPVNVMRDMFYSLQACPGEDNWVGVLQGTSVRLVRGDISRLGTDCVVLKNNSSLRATVVVHCTPYTRNYVVFDPELQATLGVRKDGLHLYRSLVPPAVPSLAFLGCQTTSPYSWLTTSLQAAWVAQLFSGRMRLPPLEVMKRDVYRQRRWRRRAFPPQHNRGSLVHWYAQSYHDQLLQDMGLPVEVKDRGGCAPLFSSCAPYTPADYRPLFQADGGGASLSSSPYKRRKTRESVSDDVEAVELTLRGDGASMMSNAAAAAAAAAAANRTAPSTVTGVSPSPSRRALLDRRLSMDRRRSIEAPRRVSMEAASRAALAQVSVTSNASRLQLLLNSRTSNAPGVEVSEVEAEPQLEIFTSAHLLMGSAAAGVSAAAAAAAAGVGGGGGGGGGSSAPVSLFGASALVPPAGTSSRRGSSLGCSRLGSQRGSTMGMAVAAAAAASAATGTVTGPYAVLQYGGSSTGPEAHLNSHPEIEVDVLGPEPRQCGDDAIEAAIAASKSPGGSSGAANVLAPEAGTAAAGARHTVPFVMPSPQSLPSSPPPPAAASTVSLGIRVGGEGPDPDYVPIPEPWVTPAAPSTAIAAASSVPDGGGDMFISPGSLNLGLPYSRSALPSGGSGSAATVILNSAVQRLTHGSPARSGSAGQWSSGPNAGRAAAFASNGGSAGGGGGGSNAQQPGVLDSAYGGQVSSSGGVRTTQRDIGSLLPPAMLSGYEVLPVGDSYVLRPALAAGMKQPSGETAGKGLAATVAAAAETAARAHARPYIDMYESFPAAGGVMPPHRSSFGDQFSAGDGGGGGGGGAMAGAAAGSSTATAAGIVSATIPGVAGGGGGGGLLVTSQPRGNLSALLAASRGGAIARSSVNGVRGVAAAGPPRSSQLRSAAGFGGDGGGGILLSSMQDIDVLESPRLRSRALHPNAQMYGSNSLMFYINERGSPPGGGGLGGGGGGGGGAALRMGITGAGGGSGPIQLTSPPPPLSAAAAAGVASGSLRSGAQRAKRRGSTVAFSNVLGNDDFVQLLLEAGNNDGRPEGVIDVRQGSGLGGRSGDFPPAAMPAGEEGTGRGGGGGSSGSGIRTATGMAAGPVAALTRRHASVQSLLLVERGGGSPGATSSSGVSGAAQLASVVLPVSAKGPRAGRGAPLGLAAVSGSAAGRAPHPTATASAAGGGGGGGSGSGLIFPAVAAAARLARMGSRGPGGFATASGFISSGQMRELDGAVYWGGRDGRGGGAASGSWRRADFVRQLTHQHASSSGMLPETVRPHQARSATLDAIVDQLRLHQHSPKQHSRREPLSPSPAAKSVASPVTRSAAAYTAGLKPDEAPQPQQHLTKAAPAASATATAAAVAAQPRRLTSAPSQEYGRSLSKMALVRGWNFLKTALGLKRSRASGSGGARRPMSGSAAATEITGGAAATAAAAATGQDVLDLKSRDARAALMYDTPPSPYRAASISRLSRQSSRGAAALNPSVSSSASAAAATPAAAFHSYDMPVAMALGRSRSYCLPHDVQRGVGGVGGVGGLAAIAGGGGGEVLYGSGLPAEAARRGGGSFTAGSRSPVSSQVHHHQGSAALRGSSRDSRGTASPWAGVGAGWGAAMASSSIRRKSTLGLGALTRLNSTGAGTGGGGGGGGGFGLSSMIGTGSVSRGDGADTSAMEYDSFRTGLGSPRLTSQDVVTPVALPLPPPPPASVGGDGVGGGGGGSGSTGTNALAVSGAFGSSKNPPHGGWDTASRPSLRRLPFRQSSSVALAVDAAAAVLAAGVVSPSPSIPLLPGRGTGLGIVPPSPPSHAAAGGSAAVLMPPSPSGRATPTPQPLVHCLDERTMYGGFSCQALIRQESVRGASAAVAGMSGGGPGGGGGGGVITAGASIVLPSDGEGAFMLSDGLDHSGTGAAAAPPLPVLLPPPQRVASELPASMQYAGVVVPSLEPSGSAAAIAGVGIVHRRQYAGGSSMGARRSGTGMGAAGPSHVASSATGYFSSESFGAPPTAVSASPTHSVAGRAPGGGGGGQTAPVGRRGRVSRRDSIIGNLLAEMAGVPGGDGLVSELPAAACGSSGGGTAAGASQIRQSTSLIGPAPAAGYDPHAPEGVIAWERPRGWEGAGGLLDGGGNAAVGGGGGSGGESEEQQRSLRGAVSELRENSSSRASRQLAAAAAAVLPSVMLGHVTVTAGTQPPAAPSPVMYSGGNALSNVPPHAVVGPSWRAVGGSRAGG
ncbi:hypothetical protein VOLCADRAFT_85967 [Volvox carteri f. nagariensis]|uniref:Flavin-containing monooxygenase n=1 Tax=Volvox carteri f. nagariensis TaxID=3068 RepID=D8THG6_VOLCA|nr:uncharacterized protein VOLCADRAFT_85967 [Volvox carteri f. nagariensis]EFJ53067.1 hypothetical protein VOLCADRAFT_85967 [Volvox carteri f. nagariensis]|eukprot:XP_002946072.1 hypothetical protein VOLCADRAFT_85967 [Volvox carteri f. nagariensis]